MSEIKLLPCPFCGTWVRIITTSDGEGNVESYGVRCTNFDCIGHWIEPMYDEESDAIESWNTRKPMQEIVERLEEDYADARKSVDIEEDYYLGMCQGLRYAICHIKEAGGIE